MKPNKMLSYRRETTLQGALLVFAKSRRLELGDNTVKPVFFTCPLFREFRETDKFAKITGRENLNTVAFQCSRKQKRQNYGVQNN